MRAMLERLKAYRRTQRLATRLLDLYHDLAWDLLRFRLWLTVTAPTEAEFVVAENRYPKLYKAYLRGIILPRELAARVRSEESRR